MRSNSVASVNDRVEKRVVWRRLPWLILAWVSFFFAIVGAILPLVPTTVFLLISAWAASKGSPRFSTWLTNHDKFGPILHCWNTQRAVPMRAKILAVSTLSISWFVLFVLQVAPLLLMILALCFIALAAYLLTRPTPSIQR